MREEEIRLLLPEMRLGAKAKERTKGTTSVPQAPSDGFPQMECLGKENGNFVNWKASQEDQNSTSKQSCTQRNLQCREELTERRASM